MLEIETWPKLREPLLVVALDGWVDAGEAGSLAAATLAAQLEGARVFGRYDLANLVDLQQTRPFVHFEEGMTRRIEWPTVQLISGACGRDVVVCRGPEPSLHWPGFARDLVEAFVALGVTQAFTLAGMPAVVSHRRPISVLGTGTDAALTAAVGGRPSDYHGPTGARTVVQVALGRAGIPTAALWAQVPHYVAGNPSPPGARALLARLGQLAAIEVGTAVLDEQINEYTNQVEAGLAERPDVAELVEAIEQEPTEELSGEALADEIEEYLREQP